MNFQKLHGKPIVCFSKEEIEQLQRDYLVHYLKREMEKQNISVNDMMAELIHHSLEKHKKISNAVGKAAAERIEHEIFVGWNILLPFYEEGSELCFELKSAFIHGRNKILSIDDLNKFRDDAFGDFIVKSSNGYRIFQLKRYRDPLNAQAVSEFIKDKLSEYGKSIGETNLLLILQSQDNNLDKLDFSALHQFLKKSGLEIKGQILIAFNANNKTSVIVQVYPEQAIAKIPIKWATGRAPDPDPHASKQQK